MKRQRFRKLHSAVELHHTLITTTALELLLEARDVNSLARRERGERKRQRKQRGTQDKCQIDRHNHTRAGTQPVRLFQTNQDQRGQDHDRRGVQNTGDGRLADSDGGSPFALAEALNGLSVLVELALGAISSRQDGVDVDTLADFLAAHEEDVQGGGTGDGGEGDEAGEDKAGIGRNAFEAGDEGVQADSHGAGGRDGHEVGLAYLRHREWGGFIGVGIVDGDVDGLVANLPEKSTGGLCC